MDINYYQKNTINTAIYPGAGSGNKEELSYLGLGLVNEAGEVAGKIKKLIRDNTFEPKQVADELGDTLWYIARLADSLGYNLTTILKWNYEKLQNRLENNTIRGSGDNR